MKKLIVFPVVLLIIIVISVLITHIAVKKVNNKKEEISPPQQLEKIINVPAICQYPTLPTGCEAVAATMVLQYYGAGITPESFAENWLKKSNNFYYSNSNLYGPDPNEVFAGDPFSKHSYGCYSIPIVKAVNSNSSEYTAQIISGTIPQICDEYINNNKPVLIWATMGMKPSEEGMQWYLPNGALFTWTAGEHCLVLVGYSNDFYYLNDPQTGTTSAYKKDLVEKRFAELGGQAVYIGKK